MIKAFSCVDIDPFCLIVCVESFPVFFQWTNSEIKWEPTNSGPPGKMAKIAMIEIILCLQC